MSTIGDQMLNLLFIYKDSRVEILVRQLRELSQVGITAVGEFDEGLQVVFERRPGVIFLQEEIDREPCASLVKHIKQLLREDTPLVYLLRDNPGRAVLDGRDLYDGILDLTGFGNDLLQEVRQMLDGVPGMLWRPQVQAPPLVAAVEPAQELADEELEAMASGLRAAVETPVNGAMTDDLVGSPVSVDEAVPFSDWETMAAEIVPPVVEPAPSPVAEKRVADRGSKENVNGETERSPSSARIVSPPVAVKKEAEALSDAISQVDELYSRRVQLRQPPRWQLGGTAAMLVLLILLGCGYYYIVMLPVKPPTPAPSTVSQPALPAPKPAPPASALSVPVVAEKPLPARLAGGTPDPAYGDKRPGWERRVTDEAELLCFREKGSLRALQLIARGRAGLPDQLVRDLFSFAGGTAVDWRDEEAKGDFRVERGVLPNRVAVLRYTRQGARVPAALVLAWP